VSDLTRFKGGAELQAALNQLPAKIEQNIMRSALRAGGNVFKAEIQQNLATNGSEETGELSAGVKVSTRSRRGKVTVTVRSSPASMRLSATGWNSPAQRRT
jgi:hypothetical protein